MRTYYRLTKPGIVYGNLVTAAAGFFLASKLHLYWVILPTLAGMALVMAAACVFNNYLDRGLDQKMARTQNRALAAGKIRPASALIYGLVLGALGFIILGLFTNWLVFGLGVIAFFFYVILYGWGKRRSVHGTLVGSIPGATPPVAGYLAVTNHLDSAAALLFLILVFWQMPHFYAIAMYRYRDYKAAGLPVLPVKSGMRMARLQIQVYIVLFTAAAAALTFLGHTGYVYLVTIILLGAYWLFTGRRYYGLSDEKWGRKMFFASLMVTMLLSLAIATGSVLP